MAKVVLHPSLSAPTDVLSILSSAHWDKAMIHQFRTVALSAKFQDKCRTRLPLPYITLDDVLSTTTQASTTTTYDDDETVASDAPAREETTVVVVTDSYNRADDESEEEEDTGYEQKCTPGSRVSTGFCVKNYLECTATGYVEKSCRVGKLFDSNSSRCVARIACEKETIRETMSLPKFQLQQRRLTADVLMSKEKVFSLWEHAVATTFAAKKMFFRMHKNRTCVI
ncbi:hypothetical protein B9Z55_002918 [Caenorhabditis nigoni]|uniref:Chitin-binding type-2 domain-containing protein n=1 Tax=Caenorhabditis nigoni TaxID=1611254 RepID=A0A2G5VMR9_9PELO|nr:hypothetical protein B9Z55_002918 [Caenorhabditis nigoni]